MTEPDGYRCQVTPYILSLIIPTVNASRRGYPGTMVRPDSSLRRAMLVLLRIPLAGKLAGANALIALAVLAAAHATSAEATVVTVLAVALLTALCVNVALVAIALRPIRALEETAWRISDGDLTARVEGSPVADARIARVGRTFNLVLDRLTADRARVRALASQVIGAAERERANVARELHDGIAQSLAAVTYQLSALERETEGDLHWRLAALRGAVADTMEEVRLLSHTMHPRVLDDLGLVAGLRYLARTVSEATGTPVKVEIAADAESQLEQLRPETSSVLFRVAQEALQNAIRHAAASEIEIRAGATEGRATIEVRDDGRGFDPNTNGRSGIGMLTMRERVSLVDGEFALQSSPGSGTVVRARVPAAA